MLYNQQEMRSPNGKRAEQRAIFRQKDRFPFTPRCNATPKLKLRFRPTSTKTKGLQFGVFRLVHTPTCSPLTD